MFGRDNSGGGGGGGDGIGAALQSKWAALICASASAGQMLFHLWFTVQLCVIARCRQISWWLYLSMTVS